MELKDLLLNSQGRFAENDLTIIGVNPIINEVIENAQLFADLLRCNQKLRITIIYESETENFNQSLFYDKDLSLAKIEFEKLQTYRNRLIGGKKAKNKKKAGFLEDVLNFCNSKEELEDFSKRFALLQNNLRHNINIIKADDVIFYSFTGLELPSIDLYQKVSAIDNNAFYKQMTNYISFMFNKKTGGLYLSKPGEELIQLYDRDDFPRGIYPRKAFYSTDFQRYSVWAFIFNRKGELLLHKRSDYVADNQSLWDKSAGGHVDLRDSSTIITAKRELVEELFLPEAEYTKYMRAELGDIIDFGEWNPEKRQEKHFKGDFDGMDDADWVVFRATDKETGDPLTVKRKSERVMHIKLKDSNGKDIVDEDGHPVFKKEVETWQTRFISDVFLFIAPEGYIDTEEQMTDLMSAAEKSGAAAEHRLISIDELTRDITNNPEKYTDDMVYINNEMRWLLLQFSEFIKYIFR